MLRLSHITAGLLFIGLSANLNAEVINLPDVEVETTEVEVTEIETPEVGTTETESTPSEFSVQLPGRGMTMENVQNRFGEALSKEAAVGTPPISKWVYKSFTVYFESEFVIHSVVNN